MRTNHLDTLTRGISREAPRRVLLRALTGIGLTSLSTTLVANRDADARKRKRRKKKCKGSKQKCGKGCCGAASQCAAGICFCTGNETQANPKCVDVAATLIEIIAEETGIAPGVIGADPEDPLVEQVTIDEAALAAIDEQIRETFLVEEEVPYYSEGIAAGAAVIREELAS